MVKKPKPLESKRSSVCFGMAKSLEAVRCAIQGAQEVLPELPALADIFLIDAVRAAEDTRNIPEPLSKGLDDVLVKIYEAQSILERVYKAERPPKEEIDSASLALNNARSTADRLINAGASLCTAKRKRP